MGSDAADNFGGDVCPVAFPRDADASPLPYEERRRSGHNGKGLVWYYRKTRLRPRERAFAEEYVAGFLAIGPVLVSAKQTRIREVLTKLAMDAVEAAHYHPQSERGYRKHAFYLMNLPRVQAEIDRIMARQGLSKERMAARMAEIMEGKGLLRVVRRRDESTGELVIFEEVFDGVAIADRSLKAIDLVFRATTGYAPTNNRLSLNMDGSTYDAEEWRETPAIAIDPALKGEADRAHRPLERDAEEPPEDEDGQDDEELVEEGEFDEDDLEEDDGDDEE